MEFTFQPIPKPGNASKLKEIVDTICTLEPDRALLIDVSRMSTQEISYMRMHVSGSINRKGHGIRSVYDPTNHTLTFERREKTPRKARKVG